MPTSSILSFLFNDFYVLAKVFQSCPILWNPMDCSLPGSFVCGILQAGILEWVAISFSRESSQPRDWTQVSHIVGRRFYCLSHQGIQRDWRNWPIWRHVKGGASGKEPACQRRRHKRSRFNPWNGKILWRRAGQPTLVFLPGESHRQRSLAGYSPWGCKE